MRPSRFEARCAAFAVSLLALTAGAWSQDAKEAPSLAERWGTTFRESYESRADARKVGFEVKMPPASAIAEGQKLPLIVVLKGGPRVSPSDEYPFIQIRPSGRQLWGYRAMSAYDTLQAIAFMKQHYPVDANRVYLVGSSAGGSGAMQLASGHADEFAAVLPLVAAGTAYPLTNFKHLPVAFHHGDRDWTSAICNVRVQHQRMKALGCPVLSVEYPGAGHSVPKPHEPLVDWLFQQRRDPRPRSIAIGCESPDEGRAHWLKILEFRDPHQRASVEATVEGTTLRVEPKNVVAFSLAPLRLPEDVVSVEVGGEPLSLDPSAELEPVEVRLGDGYWESKPLAGNGGDSGWRPYYAGAAANLYQGEPLLIVYGTAGGKARSDRLRAAAERLATCGGPVFGKMSQGFPLVADSELKPGQQAKHNLILVGAPADNSITEALMPDLPMSIREGALIAGGRSPLPLEDRVMSLVHPNPNYPRRLVCLVAPFTDEAGLARFGRTPQHFLEGSDGFNRISQADLCVRTLDRLVSRQMQFDKEWNWIDQSGADEPLPARFGGTDRSALTLEYLQLMRQKSASDFALWWGPADKGIWGTDLNYLRRYDSETYTEADYRCRRHADDSTIGSVTGAELRDIWNRWGKNREMLFAPEPDLEAIEDERSYRLHIPADLYINLGQRKKNLTDPKPGPPLRSAEIQELLFSE